MQKIKTIDMYRKYWFDYFILLFISWHCPFKSMETGGGIYLHGSAAHVLGGLIISKTLQNCYTILMLFSASVLNYTNPKILWVEKNTKIFIFLYTHWEKNCMTIWYVGKNYRSLYNRIDFYCYCLHKVHRCRT